MGGRGSRSKGPGNDANVTMKTDGDRFDVEVGHTQTFNLPTGPVSFPDSPSKASAKITDGSLELRSITVPDKYQGKGDAKKMIGKLLGEAKKRGLTLTTTGVYSQAGRGLMNSLVARGKAREIDGGRHLITGV